MQQLLQSFQILTDEEINLLVQHTTKKMLKKSDFFIREGQVCKEAAFIISGLCRSFYVSEQGAEITYCINFPNSFTTAYSSFISGNKTEENIQAISDVEMLVFPKSKLEELTDKFPNFVKFQKVIAEQQYIELEKRIIQLQKHDATQRYLNLLNNQPELIHHIPLHYLASYLNITQRHLSRIRSSITF